MYILVSHSVRDKKCSIMMTSSYSLILPIDGSLYYKLIIIVSILSTKII